MDITDQELQHIINLLANRPLAESLPLYLKLTGQRLIPDVNKQPGQVTPISKGGMPGGE